MSVSVPRCLVVAGDGVNCEAETAEAFRIAGFEVDVFHINDLIRNYIDLDRLSSTYSVLALPGGFSFSDDLESGKVLSLKLQKGLRWDLGTYVSRGGLVIGICNGFQSLIRMGVFGENVSITQNESGQFVNKWVKVSPVGGKCVWLKGIGNIDLPIRHAEGRLVFRTENRTENLSKIEKLGMTCLRYDVNPNGSEEDLAGLCDATGRILGLMPHPEANVRWTAHPSWTSQPNRAGAPGQGLAIFENAFYEARNVQ